MGGSPCSWKRLPLGVLQAALNSPFCHLPEPGVAQLQGIVESIHLASKEQRGLTAGLGSSRTPEQNLDLNPGPPESQGHCQTPRLTPKQPGNGKHQNLLALRLLRKPWQGSHPPPTVRLSQAELKRFIGFVGCCPAPHLPAFHCHSCHLHCFFPHFPWKCLSHHISFIPGQLRAQRGWPRNPAGPSFKDNFAYEAHWGALTPLGVPEFHGRQATASQPQRKHRDQLGSCVWFDLVGGTLPDLIHHFATAQLTASPAVGFPEPSPLTRGS